ncbi:hypothetical protein AB0M39_28435 [Streptomyces sp. NPDC051907]|uniref:DUF7691 family protein n=1 Tax=Streptomyces sp. NPDC051907 TaxID=3155284 RepID=UPI003445A1D5
MSYGLSLYLVDLAAVRGAIASGDEKLRRMMGGRFKRDLARDDDYFADEIANGAPTRYEALRAVIDGGPFDAAHGFQYGYAYKMVCEFHGRFLFNNHFSPFRGSWLDDVDKGMAELGVKAVAVTDFMYGSAPAPLPSSELPGYGEWSAEQCREGLAQWEASAQEQRAALDPEVLAAVESCVEWMRQAQAKEGYGIAGFGS